MFRKDDEGIPGKLINLYDFREGSESIVFEFCISNKKWLLQGNYKPPSPNHLSPNEFIHKMNCLSSMK